MAYEKSVTIEEWLKKPYCVEQSSDRSSFDVKKLAESFDFEISDLNNLSNKLGIILTKKDKDSLNRLLDERYKLINKIEENSNKIKGYNVDISSILVDLKFEDLESEKEQIEAIIRGLGGAVVSELAIKNTIKELGEELGWKVIHDAKRKVKRVGYRYINNNNVAVTATACVKLKKDFNSRMTHINELLILARFWIPLKGRITMTRGADFFIFCSEVLSESPSPDTIRDKFIDLIEIEYRE